MKQKNNFPGAFASGEKHVNVIIETPLHSRNKFNFHKESGLFKLKKVLPAGLSFPCDFGFIPGTEGADGDPLDALIIMDELTYPGCLVECRLLGVLKAEQKEKQKKKYRNDRFVCVPAEMKDLDHIKSIEDIGKAKLDAIVSFFENYNKAEQRKFKLVEIAEEKEAIKLIRKQVNV